MNINRVKSGMDVKLTKNSVFYDAWKDKEFVVECVINGDIYLSNGIGSISGFSAEDIEPF